RTCCTRFAGSTTSRRLPPSPACRPSSEAVMGQVSITYTGVSQVERVQFLDVQGLFPAVGTLWIIPQPTLPAALATLEISDGENFIQILNCRVNEASVHVNIETGMVERFEFF